MTKENLLDKLLTIHRKYSDERKTTLNSDMCSMWSTDNPPDEIVDTLPLNEIEEFVEYYFEEDDAILFYDMNIKDAAEFIFKRINDNDSTILNNNFLE